MNEHVRSYKNLFVNFVRSFFFYPHFALYVNRISVLEVVKESKFFVRSMRLIVFRVFFRLNQMQNNFRFVVDVDCCLMMCDCRRILETPTIVRRWQGLAAGSVYCVINVVR